MLNAKWVKRVLAGGLILFVVASFAQVWLKQSEEVSSRSESVAAVEPTKSERLATAGIQTDHVEERVAMGQNVDQQSAPQSAPQSVRQEETGSRLIAYYFHGNQRCYTCNLIEKMARESISELVNNKIHEAEIEFQRINVQEGFNEHYIHTFQLTNPTVVIVRYNQGQKSDHKVLNEVWRLSSQPVEFKKFIWSEVDKILSAENKMGAT